LIAMHVVVIGGGITGLSAAYYLCRLVTGAGVPMLLLNLKPRWGGKLVSEHVQTAAGPCLIEGGAESFVTRKPEAWALAHALGLGEQIIAAPNEARRIAVLRAGRVLAAPLDPLSFVTSPLISARGKLRMLAEPFLPARVDSGDESLAAFIDRRLGREVREHFVGPILGGIYNTDPERQSLMTTAPILRELERSGSLVRGVIGRAQQRRAQRSQGDRQTPPPAFFSFRNGAQTLPTALAEALTKLGADIRAGAPVHALRHDGAHWQIALNGAAPLRADAVVLATPAHVTAELLRDAAPGAAADLRAIRHTHIGTLSLIFRASELSPPQVRGVMIPRGERRPIDAITRIDAPHPRVAPGCVIVKVFFGGGDRRTAELDESAVLDVAQAQLRALMGICVKPLAWRHQRWLNDFPQADAGHLERVAAVERQLPPGVFLAGAGYRGVGVSDCVRQARDAAQAIANNRDVSFI
jgi:protoporphyrinogen/coproporphyrinogen III oxidase